MFLETIVTGNEYPSPLHTSTIYNYIIRSYTMFVKSCSGVWLHPIAVLFIPVVSDLV